MADTDRIRETVRERYAAAALTVLQGGVGSCGSAGASCCSPTAASNEGVRNYSSDEARAIPAGAVRASLGCGNPTALIDLQPGQTVLDLGSGGGIDVLLSAKRVGPEGKAYGVDMTDEMLALARQNAAEAGAANVEFLKGQIEAVPLPDASVDVVISNCVINLSTDKAAVLREAYRVLRPGGRFAVADVVVQGSGLGPRVREMLALWAGCVAGALSETDYRATLARVGFVDIEVEVTSEYGAVPGVDLAPDQRIVSAFVRAAKPAD